MPDRPPIRRSVALFATLGLTIGDAQAAPSPGSVATVSYIAPANYSLAQVARIVRGRTTLNPKKVMEAGLKSGDRIWITDTNAVIGIRMLATGRAIVVKDSEKDPKQPDHLVQEDIPGLPAKLYASFAALFHSQTPGPSFINPDQNAEPYVLAASRGITITDPAEICANPGGKSNEPVRFRIPTLAAPDNRMAPGIRGLMVGWRGGVEPYTLRILNEKKAVVAEADAIRGKCAIRLPQRDYQPGRYVLLISDGNRTRLPPIDILVDGPPPPMPKLLADADFSAPVATVYYATWLARQEDGAWMWEAAQRVAAIGCQSPGAREWFASAADNTACQ